MAEGFVQIAVDGAGKQLDNDVVAVPAGSIITNSDGTQTVLAAPAYYYRERVVISDPNDPKGVVTVTGVQGPSGQDYGQSVRLTLGQPDLRDLYSVLADIDTVLNSMMGQGFMGATASPAPVAQSLPRVTLQSPALLSSIPLPNIADPWGRQITVPVGTRDMQGATATTITAGTETTIQAANDANTYNDLLAIVLCNTSATAVRVDIRDQLSTVTGLISKIGVMPFYLPAGDTRGLALGSVLAYQSNPGQVWTATLSSAVTDVRIWALFAQNRGK